MGTEVDVKIKETKPRFRFLKFLIVVALLAGLGYLAKIYVIDWKQPPTPEKIYKHWEDSVKKSYEGILKNAQDTIKMQQKQIAQDSLDKASLAAQVDYNNQQVANTKRIYNEKLKNLSRISSDSLAKFFTDRYGKKSN